MNVGNKLRLQPTFDKEYALEDSKGPRDCVVVYIHPLERFFVVEFRSDLGVPWRETFYPYTRRIADVVDRSAPELPNEKELFAS